MTPSEILVDGVRYVPDTQSATRLSVSGMYECHLFHTIKGRTVDEVIENWLSHNRQIHPAIVGGDEVDNLGESMLCPVIVLRGDRELRRVGRMVFPREAKSDLRRFKADLESYRAALKGDPDIARLLALSNGDKQSP